MKSAIDSRYIYSELSHEIIGAAFEVQNALGPGRPEKSYQKLMAAELQSRGIKFKEQVVVDIIYKGIREITRRFDFVVENKVVVELKVGKHVERAAFQQVREYLSMSKMKLGLIILFTNEGVEAKRIPNLL